MPETAIDKPISADPEQTIDSIDDTRKAKIYHDPYIEEGRLLHLALCGACAANRSGDVGIVSS
jgi:hypothetical protein